MAQLWGGRFTKETDQLVYRFNASITFDRKFYKQDMEGSMAHVRMLAKQGILTEEERDRILEGIGKAADYRAVRRYSQFCGGESDGADRGCGQETAYGKEPE